ncbi:inositol monophosphatase family protein [Bradyrhizobium sp.]|uniref:inositol monophosphatase family protein n=1 Tax=Bradyrhizobium sp. TaxID=376 RepID=UPI0039E3C282
MTVDQAEIYLSFAAELAEEVRSLALSHFRTSLEVVQKKDESPVTIADRLIETRLRDRIASRFPSNGIYGEEMGVVAGDAFTWIIDPIDGTKSFITGFPLFGTLIAVAYENQPFCGLIDIPTTRERWTGRPQRATFGEQRATTSDCKRVGDARFYTTSPDMFRGSDAERFEKLSRSARLRRFGGDCYMYGLLASGHCDLILECGLQPYDYMAIVPIVQGAGGVMTDWNGKPLSIGSTGHVLASATQELHEEALNLIHSNM